MRWWAAALVLSAGACSASEETAPLTLSFESEAERARALSIAVRIVEGGCSAAGEVVVTYDIASDGTGMSTVPLPPGRYAVIAEARGAECTVYARGCAERELPAEGTGFHVVLGSLAAPASICGMCEACDGVGACAPDMGPECTCLEEPSPACVHAQVVCDIVDAGSVASTGKKGRFVIGPDAARPICAENAPSECGDELAACVTSRFAASMMGHLHEVRFRVHEGDERTAAPEEGATGVVYTGPATFEGIAPGGSATGTFVGAPLVLDSPEVPSHPHGIECEVYELDAGVRTLAGTGSSFTLRDVGGALAWCVTGEGSEACAAHIECVVD